VPFDPTDKDNKDLEDDNFIPKDQFPKVVVPRNLRVS
jgi:hypothetical protein